MAAKPTSEDTVFQPHTTPGQRMLSAMRLPLAILMLTSIPAAAQTADRTATPPNPAVAAPAARTGSYSIQNGELVVAPGLHIPNGNVPWALDMVDGKQTLVPIHHTQLEGVTTGTLDATGPHTPLHSTSPTFFVHSSDRTENGGDSGRGTPTGWALLAVTVTDGNRTVERPRFTDVASGTVCTAPVICTAAESLPDGWLRITVKAPLTAGEYALLPIQKPPATPTSTLAYDFTIDTAQPTARDAVSPGQNLDTKKKKRR